MLLLETDWPSMTHKVRGQSHMLPNSKATRPSCWEESCAIWQIRSTVQLPIFGATKRLRKIGVHAR